MTAEELDEVIEKAVKAFEKIEVVDTELAERLVEQGILSYDDLSVMEIADLVNTIDGLTEEQAIEIVSKAEVLAEQQTEDLPRRKGARVAVVEEAPPRNEQPEQPVEPDNAEAEEVTRLASIDDPETLPGADEATGHSYMDGIWNGEHAGAPLNGEPEAENLPAGNEDQTELAADGKVELHDVALSEESSDINPSGHEVTSAPSDTDQNETWKIVTEAVEEGTPLFPAAADASSPADERGVTKRSKRSRTAHDPEAPGNES